MLQHLFEALATKNFHPFHRTSLSGIRPGQEQLGHTAHQAPGRNRQRSPDRPQASVQPELPDQAHAVYTLLGHLS